MDWDQLLSAKRVKEAASKQPERTVFQIDFDRIVFSAAFRRLQDKTQVHPFPDSDYIRRRLTHSLEVSCVGRSLGIAAGMHLCTLSQQAPPELPFTVGQIVANACLAHDIGNPPFGHAGERAMGSWFKEWLPAALASDLTPAQRSDLDLFEGNAQGFRLLTRLQDAHDAGGLRLTYATLAAFSKYPTAAANAKSVHYVGAKKHGFFDEDAHCFSAIANAVGLIRYEQGWKRHPLVFLVEAADDICYRIIDVEDAFKLNRLSFTQAEELLIALLPSTHTYKPEEDEGESISWLRAKAIGELIGQVNDVFVTHRGDIESGAFSGSLLEETQSWPAVRKAHDVVVKQVFAWERTISAEIAGAQMITDVLERLIAAVETPGSYKNEMLLKIVPRFVPHASTYKKILAVTDFVAGMTDTYLQRIHRRLNGQAIL